MQVSASPHWLRRARFPTLTLLGVVAAALIGAVVLMGQAIMAERAHRQQATRTNAVLIGLRDLTRTAVNGETGQRGYFISLDRRYLAPYALAHSHYAGNMARLRQLMGDDLSPRQRALLDQIETLNAAKFAEMDESVRLIRSGELLEARRRILTDEGQEVMERLRSAVAELEGLELAALERAQAKAEATEARIVPLLMTLLVLILIALGIGLTQVIRATKAEAQAAHAQELASARDRADLLARELNHRVKNLFAVILAIVKMTGRGRPEAGPTVNRIAERIHALMTAHDVTQGASEHRSAHLADLVAVALEPYRSDTQLGHADGPPVALSEAAIVPVGLVLHELATNAVKYGAWQRPGGEVVVRWAREGDTLRLDWLEHCADPAAFAERAAAGPGFGTTLIDGSARQLGGTIARSYAADGIRVRIEFPLRS